MIKVHNALTRAADSREAGRELGAEFRATFGGSAPDAIVVFASAKHDYSKLLNALADEAGTETIAGASSAGEFTHGERGEGFVSAMAIRADEMRFSVGLGLGIHSDAHAAAASIVKSFAGLAPNLGRHRSALVMADALAGHTDALVEELTARTGDSRRRTFSPGAKRARTPLWPWRSFRRSRWASGLRTGGSRPANRCGLRSQKAGAWSA
jgi:hypothetical protein